MTAAPTRHSQAFVQPKEHGAKEQRAALTLHEIFRAHGAFVVRTARRMGVREADVEDVAQEVFVVVHRKLSQYDGKCGVQSWLFGIVFRVASDYRRRASVRRERLTERPPEAVTEGQEAEMHTHLARLERALESLNEVQRAVFVLYELEGMPMKEIAESLDCPTFTAYTRLRAARKRVLAALGSEKEANHG